MYRSFSIKNFRCFDELTVEGMGRINLIAGKNNVGKTALLEALWVHSGAIIPDRPMRLDRQRGIRRVDPEVTIDNLFFGFGRESIIQLESSGDWGNTPRRLEIAAKENISGHRQVLIVRRWQTSLILNNLGILHKTK